MLGLILDINRFNVSIVENALHKVAIFGLMSVYIQARSLMSVKNAAGGFLGRET